MNNPFDASKIFLLHCVAEFYVVVFANQRIESANVPLMELSPIHFDAEVEQTTENTSKPAFDQLTASTLQENLLCDKQLSFFLRTSGIFYADRNDGVVIVFVQSVWTTLVRFFVVFMFGFGIYFFSAHMANGISGPFDLTYACMGMALASQAIIISPSIPMMVFRLQSPALLTDIPHFAKTKMLCRAVFYTSIILGIFVLFQTYCGYGQTNDDDTCVANATTAALTALQALGHLAMSCVLAANCMFVLSDCFASVSMVEELILLHNKKALSLERFNFCRADIQYRVSSNYWTYNATMLVAILDVVAIVVLIFIDGALPVMCVAFVKEIPFVLAALYYSMTVNEKSDQLTKLLGKCHVLI